MASETGGLPSVIFNPQELADFTRTLRGLGYNGPVTADNINQLLQRANEIRSSPSTTAWGNGIRKAGSVKYVLTSDI
jgi:hypothetical protein